MFSPRNGVSTNRHQARARRPLAVPQIRLDARLGARSGRIPRSPVRGNYTQISRFSRFLSELRYTDVKRFVLCFMARLLGAAIAGSRAQDEAPVNPEMQRQELVNLETENARA